MVGICHAPCAREGQHIRIGAVRPGHQNVRRPCGLRYHRHKTLHPFGIELTTPGIHGGWTSNETHLARFQLPKFRDDASSKRVSHDGEIRMHELKCIAESFDQVSSNGIELFCEGKLLIIIRHSTTLFACLWTQLPHFVPNT